MTNRHDNILGTIGNTPVVKINRLAPAGVNLYVKIEAFNPMGSVKDRLALGVIEDAERKGLLKPGQTIVEATSGNTGIGLAMVCAQKGYPLVVTMAESFSIERRKLLRFLGAKVVLTPAAEKGTGMVAKAEELAEKHGWFLTRQFDNEANADIHSTTTAPEILRDFADTQLDYWVTGFGTGGTLKGVARVLRDKSPNTKIIVCEPDNSPLLGSGIPQDRDSEGNPAASHPSFRPHVMQGWVPDFISNLTEDAVTQTLIDEVLPIDGAEAIRLSQELARQEGIFVGISAGATFAGALEVCRNAPEGSNVLCMLPDTGERYLSTPLFEGIGVDMNDDEIGISQSTPGFRFDEMPAAPKEAAPKEVENKSENSAEQKNLHEVTANTQVSSAAREFVDQVTSDADEPVVLFALEWCEFCWSVRRMLTKAGISYRSVDLDSLAYQDNNWGGQIRAALTERTSCATIPQIFVAGEYIGGCTEIFDAYVEGDLQERLTRTGADFDQTIKLDPHAFLPDWLHPRAQAGTEESPDRPAAN